MSFPTSTLRENAAANNTKSLLLICPSAFWSTRPGAGGTLFENHCANTTRSELVDLAVVLSPESRRSHKCAGPEDRPGAAEDSLPVATCAASCRQH